MRAPLSGELRTFAVIQTNAPKVSNGSGVVGAGFKDVYTTFKTVRGKFEQKTGTRELSDGKVVPINRYIYTIRFENAILTILNLQTRFVIKSNTYTLNSWKPLEEGKERFLVFDLLQYST